MNYKNKAQGTIEYLIILAIIIVIALVLVNLLFELMNNASTISEPQAKSNWLRASPWGIVDWKLNSDGNAFIVLKNNTNRTMGFNYILLDGINGTDKNDTPARVTPTATITVIVPTNYIYPSGSKFSISSEDIIIDFNSSTFPYLKQYGVSELVGVVQ
jgi:hypothetical protein